MGLFKPAWMTTDFSKRDKAIAAVRSMTDQRELKRVALEAPRVDVIEAALARLSDPAILYEIAVEASTKKARDNRYDEIGAIAVMGIDDQDMLRDLAANPRVSDPIRGIAVRKISDQGLIRELILDDSVGDIAKGVAVSLVDDPSLVDSVALDHARYGSNTRDKAVARTENPEVLAAIARNDPSPTMRMAALQRADQRIVAEIALSDQNRDVRYKAIKLLMDQATLETIARDEIDHYFRFMALEKIDDANLRRDIEASWNDEQRRADSYAAMQADAVHQHAQALAERDRRISEGRCPHCGVLLTSPRGGIPDGAAVYCSNCGKRVR